MIKSLSFSQSEVLKWIYDLYLQDGIHVDCTYGNGAFYKNQEFSPEICIDLDPLTDSVVDGDSRCLKFAGNSVGNMIFDPPFITYVKKGRDHNSIMAKRFGGYYTYGELESHYLQSVIEFSRIMKHKSKLVFKCQDIIHNHKMHCTHAMVIEMCEERGFRLKDMFILGAKSRMPIGKNKTQRHARIHHSYFLVFERWSK